NASPADRRGRGHGSSSASPGRRSGEAVPIPPPYCIKLLPAQGCGASLLRMRYATRPADPPEPRPRRSRLHIVALLSLAALSVFFLVKWNASLTRADQLHSELKQVYAEAESLRSRAMHAEQRIADLEKDVRFCRRGRYAPTRRRLA